MLDKDEQIRLLRLQLQDAIQHLSLMPASDRYRETLALARNTQAILDATNPDCAMSAETAQFWQWCSSKGVIAHKLSLIESTALRNTWERDVRPTLTADTASQVAMREAADSVRSAPGALEINRTLGMQYYNDQDGDPPKPG